MNKVTVLLAMLMIVLSAGLSNASLTTIGTATYGGNDYNLIYEDDSIEGGLVWLDYTKSDANWQDQVAWASGLGSSLEVTLVGYWTTLDWTVGWRLPLTQDPTIGYQAGSEMGHLYYDSLKNTAGTTSGVLDNVGPFDNLTSGDYWSGTEATIDADLDSAWYFYFNVGWQEYYYKWFSGTGALAVRPGQVWEVSAVPIPSAVLLLGSGLIGLVGIRRKFRK